MSALTSESIATEPKRRLRTLSEAIFFERPMGENWHERLQNALIHEYEHGPTYLLEPVPEPAPKPPKEPYRKPEHLLSMHPKAILNREYQARRKENGGQPIRGTALEIHRPKSSPSEKPKTPWKAKDTIRARVKSAIVMAKPVIRLPNCETCGREFGPDRQRHWFNENRCNGCLNA